MKNLTRRAIHADAPDAVPFLSARAAGQYGPGVTDTEISPTDFAPVKQVQMGRFDGERWQLFGPLLTGGVG